MKNNIIIIAIVTLAIGGGAGFFGGMKYQQSKNPTFTRQFGNNMMNGQRNGNGQNEAGNRMGFRPVAGEIISSDNKSITVKLTDGSSKIVILSDKTEINKAQTATKDELKTGEKVSVFGTENSDGSVTAQSIQLNPILRIPTPTN